MARIVVEFCKGKMDTLFTALTNEGMWLVDGGRIKNISKTAPKTTITDTPKPADFYIPLEWVDCFHKSQDGVLTVVFQDGVQFRPGNDKLFFVKGNEKAFVNINDVYKVHELKQ